MPYVTSWERMAAKKAKEEDTKRMLEEGLDISLIQKITGLSKEEITRLETAADEAGEPKI